MGNWREAAQRALGEDGRFLEVSKKITSGNLTAETRMDSRVGSAAEVYPVYPVYNPPSHIKPFFNKLLPIVENYKGMDNDRNADSEIHNRVTAKTPDKPNKPHNPVNSVSEVNSVNRRASISRSIVVAVRTGDPATIAAAVAEDPELIERAAIREHDGGMCRLDADLAALLDVIDEAGYVL